MKEWQMVIFRHFEQKCQNFTVTTVRHAQCTHIVYLFGMLNVIAAGKVCLRHILFRLHISVNRRERWLHAQLISPKSNRLCVIHWFGFVSLIFINLPQSPNDSTAQHRVYWYKWIFPNRMLTTLWAEFIVQVIATSLAIIKLWYAWNAPINCTW